MKQKKKLKKERNIDKQKWTCPVCKGAWKESQIDWIVCRIYSVGAWTDFVLGIILGVSLLI